MITGCNTNVRHAGRTFHVQTEDSGRANPHIISHVYHGGTILASEKSEYGEIVDSDSGAVDSKVKELIEAQHKAMLKRLAGGEFDPVIAERLGDPAPAKAPPTQPDLREQAPAGVSTDVGMVTGGVDTAPSVVDEVVPSPEAASLGSPTGPAFGDSVDSEKPLDEVILEYLVKKARDRGGESKKTSRARRKG